MVEGVCQPRCWMRARGECGRFGDGLGWRGADGFGSACRGLCGSGCGPEACGREVVRGAAAGVKSRGG